MVRLPVATTSPIDIMVQSLSTTPQNTVTGPALAAGAVHEKVQVVRSSLPFEKMTSQSTHSPVVPGAIEVGQVCGHELADCPESEASTPAVEPSAFSKRAAKLFTCAMYWSQPDMPTRSPWSVVCTV
jgi:hypothetical protein